MAQVIIVGGGFAGLNVARGLGSRQGIEVTLIDKNNHHLFQPLLYQVAMAGLSPADIAVPIRSLLHEHRNIRVLQGEVERVDLDSRQVHCRHGDSFVYDYLILAAGVRHTYFGNDSWERFAPGLKTIEQATEIRRRVLAAFEEAERTEDPQEQQRLLTFVIVGGGPTGVELAGAIGEMSRFTLSDDFRNIDPSSTRIKLVEASPQILEAFHPKLAEKAERYLRDLGVEVLTDSLVEKVDERGVICAGERIEAATVLWAAGVAAQGLGRSMGVETDSSGRFMVEPDLSLPGHPEVFVAGDLAHFSHGLQKPLPGMAPVALQQGRFLARLIRSEVSGKQRPERFEYWNKGQMATIGRSRAIAETKRFRMAGFLAWLAWLVVHIYYLTGFRNRLLVVLQWAWHYLTFQRGARLIVSKEWMFYPDD